MHRLYADPGARAALYRLFDRVWPGMAGRIARAAAMGWRWDEVTTPFVRLAGGEPVSHVGVLELPVRLGGHDVSIAGIHAVCTDPAHRGRGHYRAAMEEALAFVDARFSIAKLHTEQPELYEPFGFRVVPQHRFRLERRGGPGPGRAVREADLAAVHALLAGRAPTSNHFAARDPGWLLGIDEVLSTGGLSHLRLVGEAPILVACEVAGGVLRVLDAVAPEAPPLAAVLEAAPESYRAVELWMSADILAPGARPLTWPADDLLMVRGEWPELPPFAVGPLASH